MYTVQFTIINLTRVETVDNNPSPAGMPGIGGNMIGQCTPIRWQQYTGFATVNGLIKTVDKAHNAILIDTDDTALLCYLSQLGELHYHEPQLGDLDFEPTGLILFVAYGEGQFDVILHHLKNHYTYSRFPAVEYLEKVLSQATK